MIATSEPYMFRSCLALLFLTGVPSYGQFVSFGGKVGVPLTSAFSSTQVPDGASSASQDHFIVGPTAELHFPLHVSLEVDALYRRNSFYVQGNQLGGSYNINTHVNDWQVPFLAKYEISLAGLLRPFVDAGVVYRHVSTSNNGQNVVPLNPNTVGYAVGGGVALKFLHLRITPEIRYTHWTTSSFAVPFITDQSNQADLLVGVTF